MKFRTLLFLAACSAAQQLVAAVPITLNGDDVITEAAWTTANVNAAMTGWNANGTATLNWTRINAPTTPAGYGIDDDLSALLADYYTASQADVRFPLVDLDTSYLMRPDQLYRVAAKLAKSLQPNSGNVITILGLGDSYTTRMWPFVIEQLVSEYGLKLGYGFGDGRWDAVGGGIAATLEGSATYEIKTDYTTSPSGNYWSLSSSTGDAVTYYDNRTDGLFDSFNRLDVYYVAEDGAGTFDVQTSSTALDAGFSQLGTTIDADNGAAAQLVRQSYSFAAQDLAVRIVAQSGTVRIRGIVAYDSTANTLLVLDFGESSAAPSSLSNTTPATWQTLLEATDPDLIFYTYDDAVGNQTSGLAALSNGIDAASALPAAPNVLITPPWPKDGMDTAAIAAGMRAYLVANHPEWAFFDQSAAFGNVWDWLDSVSLGADGVHPDPALAAWTVNDLFRRAGWDYTIWDVPSRRNLDDFSSGLAVAGTVPTADGAGNITWAPPSVGAGQGIYFDTTESRMRTPGDPLGGFTPSAGDSVTLYGKFSIESFAVSGTTIYLGSLFRTRFDTTGTGDLILNDGVHAISSITWPYGRLGLHNLIITIDGSTADVYLDGTLVASTDTSSITGTLSAPYLQLGASYASEKLRGFFYECGLFNRKLTGSEIANLSGYGLDWLLTSNNKYPWGSRLASTSGTLVTGQSYRIKDHVAGDDFTNVGAGSNATGVEFVASGTTPTDWSNGSSVVALGAVVAFTTGGLQYNTWHDRSPNQYDLYNAVAASHLPAIEPLESFTVRGSLTWSASTSTQALVFDRRLLPAGAIVEAIYVNAPATPAEISVGDGTDADYWVEATTGLAEGWQRLELAHVKASGDTDAVNKITVTPQSSVTGTYEFIATISNPSLTK